MIAFHLLRSLPILVAAAFTVCIPMAWTQEPHQENTAATSPARSAPAEKTAAQAPGASQGDDGPVASPTPNVTPVNAGDPARLAELDAYWAEVSRAVKAGDFEAYQATCHAEGVLVSGSKRMSQPLAAALARWRKEFIDTREGRVLAGVAFRFSNRVGDATTAHETGIFRYVSQTPGGPPKVEFIHFEGLLVKRPDGWKILMENQKGPATEEEWTALE